MEYRRYPLLCYWNGELLEANGVVSYRGGDQCFVFADSVWTYEELIGELIKAMGIDKTRMRVEVKMKYPSLGCFKIVPLNSENTLQALWACVENSKSPSMDLYVDIVPIEPSSHFPESVPVSNSLTRMLTDNDYFLDNIASLSQLNVHSDGREFDELNQEDVEGDEAEAELNANHLVEVTEAELEVGDGAPSQEFCNVGEVDHGHVNSWRTWDNMVEAQEGGGGGVCGWFKVSK